MPHTKGPWVIFSDKGVASSVMPAGRQGDICILPRDHKSVVEINANALLIVAAPDLLMRLEATTDCFERSCRLMTKEQRESAAEVIDDNRAFIKLAKGDS